LWGGERTKNISSKKKVNKNNNLQTKNNQKQPKNNEKRGKNEKIN